MAFTLNPIGQQTAGKVFTVSGSFTAGVSGAQYEDAAGAWNAIPAPTTVQWSFTHPAITTVGPFKISVRYPGTALLVSQTINVVGTAPTPPVITGVFTKDFDHPPFS